MKKAVRVIVLCALALAVCIPLSIVLTLVLLPVWSWIEATFGVESVGHSGPAAWCYWSIYGVLSSAAVAILLLRSGARSAKAHDGLVG